MTTTMTRRALLGATALIPAALIGCQNALQQVPRYVAAINAVGQEAALIAPQLKAAGMSDSDAATLQTAVASLEQAARAVTAASSATAGQSALIQIEGYINAIAPIAAPFVAGIPGGAAIGLIIAALPAIELLVNMSVSLLSNEAQSLAASAPPAPAVSGRRGAVAPLSPAAALDRLLAVTGQR